MSDTSVTEKVLDNQFRDTELVIGLVGAIGTDLHAAAELIKVQLGQYGYHDSEVIHVSRTVIPAIVDVDVHNKNNEGQRILAFMNAGNKARQKTNNDNVLGLGIAARIYDQQQDDGFRPRTAYIINSLKRPEEVSLLRQIYNEGFFLFGIYASESERKVRLCDHLHIDDDEAKHLMELDEDDQEPHGQRTRDTFQMADFFLHADGKEQHLSEQVQRILRIIFAHPYSTPTFDEFAMFMAFSASLRSADLARQVGAIVAKNQEILATGANDCPKYGGGLYWPELDPATFKVEDIKGGRDYTLGADPNTRERQELVKEVAATLRERLPLEPIELEEILSEGPLRNITEYGRSVHAEMEALLSCARNNISCRDSTLFTTTFPCHNCARHIIAAGVSRVVYVEPYPKSRAISLHHDAITTTGENKMLRFEHFVGVGPRRFFDLFSLRLGSGFPYERKQKSGDVVPWVPDRARARLQMLPVSYLDREKLAANQFNLLKRK